MTHLEMFRRILDETGCDHEVEYSLDGDISNVAIKIDTPHSEIQSTIWATFAKSGAFIIFDVVSSRDGDEPLTGEPPKDE